MHSSNSTPALAPALRQWGRAACAAALALLAPLAWAGGMDSLSDFVKQARSGKAGFTQVVTAPWALGEGLQHQDANRHLRIPAPRQVSF